MKNSVTNMELSIKELQKQEEKYSAELQIALKEFAEIWEQAEAFDGSELAEERLNIRPQKQQEYYAELREIHGIKFEPDTASESLVQTDNMLGEDLYSQKRSILEKLRRPPQYEQKREERKQKHKRREDEDLEL